jgi:hypothetical protein
MLNDHRRNWGGESRSAQGVAHAQGTATRTTEQREMRTAGERETEKQGSELKDAAEGGR